MLVDRQTQRRRRIRPPHDHTLGLQPDPQVWWAQTPGTHPHHRTETQAGQEPTFGISPWVETDRWVPEKASHRMFSWLTYLEGQARWWTRALPGGQTSFELSPCDLAESELPRHPLPCPSRKPRVSLSSAQHPHENSGSSVVLPHVMFIGIPELHSLELTQN